MKYLVPLALLFAIAVASPLRFSATIGQLGYIYPLNPTVVDPNNISISINARGNSANGEIDIEVTDPITFCIEGGCGTRAQNLSLSAKAKRGYVDLVSYESHIGPQAFGTVSNMSYVGMWNNRDGYNQDYSYLLGITRVNAAGITINSRVPIRASFFDGEVDTNTGILSTEVIGMAWAYVNPNPFGTPHIPYQVVAIIGTLNQYNKHINGYKAESPYPTSLSPYTQAAPRPGFGNMEGTVDGVTVRSIVNFETIDGLIKIVGGVLTGRVSFDRDDDRVATVKIGKIVTPAKTYIVENLDLLFV